MYSSIVEIVQNREFLDSVRKGWSYGSNLDLFSSLPSYNSCVEFESTIDDEFDAIFAEPLGYYLIKCFLGLTCSDDKAVFVSDVKLYKSLTDPSGRIHISKKIYIKYCSTGSKNKKEKDKYIRGVSVFEQTQMRRRTTNLRVEQKGDEDNPSYPCTGYMQLASESRTELNASHAECRNAIDCYGDVIDECFHSIFVVDSSALDMFDAIVERVLIDLRENVFPLFQSSSLYRLYVQCQMMCVRSMASAEIVVDNFQTLRVLGRGAFGFVNAVIKKNTGHMYAMKCINKKRVMATDSVETIMSERNFLSDMNSNFVTGLAYAVMDSSTLYLIIDLMVGGDLKFHLNKEGRFNIERSRFYAAEVLLGLQHIHSKGIIYRDIKLENVLLDNRGHCKISDLGLAVRSKEKVRGYAGTPGYTAPEVCLQQSYGSKADFFSFGVMIYRFLSGRKPFQVKNKAKAKAEAAAAKLKKKDAKKKGHRSGNELDKNVVEIEPEYPDRYFTPSARSLLKGLMCKNPRWRLAAIEEIKRHAWFTTKIEFGLLESGHLTPPFVPNQDEINADSLRHIGRPPNDDKYKDVECTPHFEKSLSKFAFCSPQVQQQEIVDVLKKIKTNYSFERFMKIISKNTLLQEDITHELAQIPPAKQLNEWAQHMRMFKEEYGMNAFIPQYYQKKQQQEDDEEEEYLYAEEEEDDEDHKYKHKYKLIEENENTVITESSVSHTNDKIDKTEQQTTTKPVVILSSSAAAAAAAADGVAVVGKQQNNEQIQNNTQCLSCDIL